MPALSTRKQRARGSCFTSTLTLLVGVALGLAALAVAGPALWVFWCTHSLRYGSAGTVPQSTVAVVFGAGLGPDGQPSAVLADRVHAAVLLYRAGKVRNLLMSGDGQDRFHDEPAAMMRQAVAEGVPSRAILLDRQGVRTFATCSDARELYGVRSAVVVSQSYHLPRAIYTCRMLGINTVGFSFARVPYGQEIGLRVRELLSLDLAWWQLHQSAL